MQESYNQIVSLFIITTFIIFLFVIFIFFILYFFRKNQVKLKNDIQILNLNHEKALLNTQLEIQEQTFKNISQEIHDNISLSLTLAKLNLNTIEFIDNEKGKIIIENSVDLISKSLNDLNDISKSLDSELIKSHGLIYAIEAETGILLKSGRYEVDLQVCGEPIYLEAETELILFRILQESCNNILKHSKCTRIELRVIYTKDKFQLTIRDNGRGFDQKNTVNMKLKPGSGLNNIRNRAKMINASANILSIPGSGTTITIELPLKLQTEMNGTKN